MFGIHYLKNNIVYFKKATQKIYSQNIIIDNHLSDYNCENKFLSFLNIYSKKYIHKLRYNNNITNNIKNIVVNIFKISTDIKLNSSIFKYNLLLNDETFYKADFNQIIINNILGDNYTIIISDKIKTDDIYIYTKQNYYLSNNLTYIKSNHILIPGIYKIINTETKSNTILQDIKIIGNIEKLYQKIELY